MRSKTQTTFFALAASAAATLSIAAVASPAAARGPSDMVSVEAKAASKAAGSKKICMTIEPITGTRVARKLCKTRAEWEAEGYTVTTRAKAKAAG